MGGHEYPKDLQARFHDLHVVIIDPRGVSCLTLGSCPLTANIMLIELIVTLEEYSCSVALKTSVPRL